MPRRSKDYNRGKIYKLISPSGLQYVGSTTQVLCNRLSCHKTDYKRWKEGKKNYISSFQLFDEGNVCIILIENYPCANVEELEARENYWIRTIEGGCVNIVLPQRTRKEYYEDNKQVIIEQHKIYQEQNKEKIKAQQKQYREKNKEKIKEEQKQYREQNKEKIKEQQKKYREANLEKVRERDRNRNRNRQEYNRKYREANLEKLREYDKNRRKK